MKIWWRKTKNDIFFLIFMSVTKMELQKHFAVFCTAEAKHKITELYHKMQMTFVHFASGEYAKNSARGNNSKQEYK